MATGQAAADCRPMRADARRNREAILKAARKVFARHGRDAQMDDIARRAGVGMGTVYRHFPTKDALVDALIADRVHQICRLTEDALEAEDAWEALRTALWAGAEMAARDRALTEIFSDRPDRIGAAHAAREDLAANTAELVRRATAAGAVRPDLTAEDIAVAMCGITQAMHTTGGPTAWRRHLQLVLDGMRASAATAPLPQD